jgi:hypothetical protein
MRLPATVANPSLVVLIAGAGFSSRERFAEAVNRRGWQMHGVKLTYDHVSVKRWLAGSTCQYPDVVAAVLSDAWGIPIPVDVIWPQLREGSRPAPAHLQPWVAARTLEDLGVFLRSDVLTRRDILTASVGVVAGKAFTDPVARWLDAEALGLAAGDGRNFGKINVSAVEGIEHATRQFAASDATAGGGLTREAAIGQLKYAVDLARHSRFTEQVGGRLLAAIADLAGWVGWMSHDAAMPGPAQRYLTYALQAAHEAGTERARLRAVGVLADMARQMQSLGEPDTGVRLVELALERLPKDRKRFNAVRGMLWNLKANLLAGTDPGCAPEVRSAIGLSFDLYHQAKDDHRVPEAVDYYPYTCEAELASVAAACYRDLAHVRPEFAALAEQQALFALAHRDHSFTRSKAFDQINLARIRFHMAEPEQACLDGSRALELAATVQASSRVRVQLTQLVADAEPYLPHPAVREFREKSIQLIDENG